MRQRLISEAQSTRWAEQIAEAMFAAQDRMGHKIASTLTAHGLSWSSPRTALTVPVWDQGAWISAVEADVEPAARKIAVAIVAHLRARAPLSARRGIDDPVDVMVSLVTARAISGGPGMSNHLGGRAGLTAAGVDLDAIRAKIAAAPDRFGGVVHPESKSTIADAYQQMYDNLNQLVSNTASHMGNAGIVAIGDAAAAAGSSVQHVWNATEDERTREDHANADGQTQNAGDPFEVGGEEGMYPGDPSFSDAQSCNCRCWLETVGLEDTGAGAAEDEESDVG